VDVQQLCQRVGQLGDERLARRLFPPGKRPPALDPDTDPPLWSLVYRLWVWTEERGGTVRDWLVLLALVPLILFFFPALLALDILHALVRVPLYLIVVRVWRLERWRRVRLGLTYFCEHCFNNMISPVLLCPTLGCRHRLQPTLRPTYNSLLTRLCPGCRRTWWWVIGHHSRRRSGALVCMGGQGNRGCGRQLTLPALAGRKRRHIALVGTSVRARHVILAECLRALEEGRVGRQRCIADGQLGRFEAELARQVLCRSYSQDTRPLDHPGQKYSLAHSLVLEPVGRDPAVVFHNLLASWIETSHRLAQKACNWNVTQRLLLVVDAQRVSREEQLRGLPDAEVYSRLVRDVEEFLGWPLGEPVPLRTAVVLAWPPGETKVPGDPAGWLAANDAALSALLRLSLRPRQLAIFTGAIPADPHLSGTDWLSKALAWLLR
jgi:hypothetical protein